MGIIKEEAILALDIKIANIEIHINGLQKSISDNPNLDIPDKPSRQSVLESFIIKRDFLISEKLALTNQG